MMSDFLLKYGHFHITLYDSEFYYSFLVFFEATPSEWIGYSLITTRWRYKSSSSQPQLICDSARLLVTAQMGLEFWLLVWSPQSSQVVLVVKNPPPKARDPKDTGSIPGLERSLDLRALQHTPVFLLGESHGQRSLEGYSSWGHKESDTTEVT